MAQLTLQQVFERIFRQMREGRVREAEELCRTVLAQVPGNVDGLYVLGMIYCQSGRHAEAIGLLKQVQERAPGHPESLNLLGQALQVTGDGEGAIAAFRQALAAKPGMVDARYGLAHALFGEHKVEEAIAEFGRVVAAAPQLADAHYYLAEALHDAGRVEEAIAEYREVIRLKPDHAEAHNNQGSALRELGRGTEAIAAYEKAVAVRGDFPEALNNLANALHESKRSAEAIAAYRRAIAFRPAFAEAHANLGRVLKDEGLVDEAVAQCRKAIELRPELAEAHANLARALKEKGFVDEAMLAARRALELDAGLPEAMLILGELLKDGGRVREALPLFRRAHEIRPAADVHSNLIYTMHFDPALDEAAIERELRAWDRQHAQPLRASERGYANTREPERRLRVGYVSPNLRAHVVGLNMAPLFANHDRDRFEIFAYSDVRKADALTQQLRGSVQQWRPIFGLDDEAVAKQIREDGIDILVDLSLHLAENRLTLFARKPAPVQVTFAGYPGSTGLRAIDYRLSDPYLDPAGRDESRYSEKTIRLPHNFWCYAPIGGEDLPITPLPARTNGFVTFGCLNNFAKVNENLLELWAQVMRDVAASRLHLLAAEGEHRERVRAFLAERGVERSRVESFSFRARREYLKLFAAIDVGLDCFPYNGHTTSLDSYWMGVPVVTLVGEHPVSRAGWSQLSNLGLTELAAHSRGEFVRIAAELARDHDRLGALRLGMRERMMASPLMDAAGFARGIEAAYQRMWRAWCVG